MFTGERDETIAFLAKRQTMLTTARVLHGLKWSHTHTSGFTQAVACACMYVCVCVCVRAYVCM